MGLPEAHVLKFPTGEIQSRSTWSTGVVLALRDGLTWEAQLGESLQEGNCLGISGGSRANGFLVQHL